jgi:hypothetical protein
MEIAMTMATRQFFGLGWASWLSRKSLQVFGENSILEFLGKLGEQLGALIATLFGIP